MESNLEIVRITPNLNLMDEIKQIELEAFGDGSIDEWVIMPLMRYGRIYGALLEGKLIGIIEMIISEKGQGYIFSFAIAREYRGQGFGSRFLLALIDELSRESHLCEICLTSAEENEVANYMYRKMGFEATEKLKNEYGVGIDRVYWRKKLI